MKKAQIAVFMILLAAGLIFAAGACGGGGGTTAVAPDAFSGCYSLLLWLGNPSGPSAAAGWGTANANGLGAMTGGSDTFNVAGAIMGPGPFDPFTYTIDAANRIEWADDTQPLGGISVDGSLLALGTRVLFPGVILLGRKGSGYSAASLNGDYHVAAFQWNGTNEITWWGTITFDGAGNTPGISLGSNTNGVILAPGAPIAYGTYAVAPDGTATMSTPFPGVSYSGAIMNGGELVVLTGVTTATNIQILLILVKKGAALTDATFSGNYHLVGLFANNAAPPHYSSYTGVSTADGAGTWTIGAITVNSDGVVTTGAGGPASYTVAGDGALDIATGNYLGGVSPSGDVAVAAGNATGSHPELYFLFR